MSSIKFVTAEDLQSVLQKLKDWMPFQKTEKGIEIIGEGNGEDTIFNIKVESGDAFKVKGDGTVYVKNGDEDVSLQDIINSTLEPHEEITNIEIDKMIEEKDKNDKNKENTTI